MNPFSPSPINLAYRREYVVSRQSDHQKVGRWTESRGDILLPPFLDIRTC